MNNLYLILLILFLTSCNSEANKSVSKDSTLTFDNYAKDSSIGRGTFLSDKELEYLKTRERFIAFFQKHPSIDFKNSIFKQEKDSLLVLENLMKLILKDARFAGGVNNLTTLYEGYEESSMLDGLNNWQDSIQIFWTTKNLFFQFFQNEPISLLDRLTKKDLETIFLRGFFSDAAVMNLTTIKLASSKNVQSYGILAYNAQDYGPFIPDQIYVLVADEKYVYMSRKEIDIKMDTIIECKNVWDSLIKKPYNEDLSDEAWDKYCGCYEEKFKKLNQYDLLKKEMQNIVDYVLSKK